MSVLGTICFAPVNAELTLDVRWFGKMSPYIKVRLDGQKKKTIANYDSGLKPQWKNEWLVLDFFSDSGKVQVDCLDYAIIGRGTYIGIGYIDVQSLLKNGEFRGQQFVEILKNKKYSGFVLLNWKFFSRDENVELSLANDTKKSLKDASAKNEPKQDMESQQNSNSTSKSDTNDNSKRNSEEIDILKYGISQKSNKNSLTKKNFDLSDKQKSEPKYTPVKRDPNDKNIGKKIDKYHLIKHLGSGQFGDVYMAADGTSNPCAVKVISKSKILKQPILIKYLKHEVSIMKKVDHPNVIKLYDFAESASSFYIAMQYCDNGDVRQYMKKKGITFFKEEEAIFFLKQIALGFRELHKHKVMHRDFKVDNLFMNGSTIIIADLGFSKSGKDMFHSVCGSPAYMAPEVMSEQPYTNLADLWSVGVTFFEILFGRFPFNGHSIKELQIQAKTASGKNIEIPHHINPVSQSCVDLLQKILEHDVQKRISWEDFFNHPIFKIDQNIYASGIYNPLGSTIEMSKEINNRFEEHKQYGPTIEVFTETRNRSESDKCGLAPPEDIQNKNSQTKINEQDMNNNIQIDGEKYLDENDKSCKQNFVTNINEVDDNFDIINGAYLHEKNKAQFIREVAYSVNFSSKYFHNPNGVIMTAIMQCKKAKIYFDSYKYSQCNSKKNAFNFEKFDEWLQSEIYNNITSIFEQESQKLNQEWVKFKDEARTVKFDWNQADKKIIDTIDDPNTNVKEIDNIINEKMSEMKQKLLDIMDWDESDIKNKLIKKKLILLIIMTKIATSVHKKIEYHPGEDFNWKDQTINYQSMDLEDLKELFESIEKK